jgi:glycosyltransferase involved in cell wall biosynthesis
VTALATFGVPGYRGEAFMAETLASLQAQSCADFEVLISLDGPGPALEAVCRPFLDDPRFRLVVQPERMGWVGNLNWLMERTSTPYWLYQQQDDVLEPTYLEVLLTEAERMPEAAVVYCDIVTFGTIDARLSQPSVGGSPVGRQLTLIQDHHSAVAFRGLTRTDALHATGRIRPNGAGCFSSDTLWMSSIARSGELVRVPEPLYRKRYHDANEHSRWARWPDDERARAWRLHCAQQLDEALLVDATVAERRLLWSAVLTRLVTGRPTDYLPASYREGEARDQQVQRFFNHVRRHALVDVPALLGTDWPALRRWSRAWLAGPEPSAGSEAGALAEEGGDGVGAAEH